MASDGVIEGFKAVFSFLKSDKCNIHDDAVLHIFVDVLKITLKDNETIDQCCLIEFLNDVGDLAETLDDGIVTVALEIAGWLGSDEDRFVHFLFPLSKHLRSIWKKSSISDISVLSSLFNCLSCLTKHGKGVEWLITENEDIHREWLSILKNGSSIFLQKAVVQYIYRLCTSSDMGRFTNFLEHIICSDVLPVVRNYSSASQDKKKTYTTAFFVSVLKLLEDMCSSAQVCDIIASTNTMEELGNIVLLINRSESQAAMNVIKAFGINKKAEVEPMLGRISKQLCDKGDILMAQNLAIMSILSMEDSTVTKSHELLLLPLKYVLGQFDRENEHETTMSLKNLPDRMSTKHQLTTILCKTIANMSSVKLVVPDIIARVLTATLSECDEINPDLKWHLLHNYKVQRSCLQYFCDFEVEHILTKEVTSDQGDLAEEIASSVIQIMSPSDVDSQTFSLCVKCLTPLLPRLLTSSNQIRNIPEEVAFILQQQLCSLQWEQRDTTLEFLSQVIITYKESEPIRVWIDNARLHHHAWQCRQDGESYVRATAIACLYSISTSGQLWSSLLDIIGLSEEQVIKHVGEMLESDTEAFTRRSAANFLFKFYCDRVDRSSDEMFHYIVKTVTACIQDFDWEVKLLVLDFIEMLLNREVNDIKQRSCVPDYVRSLQGSETCSTSISLDTVILRFREWFGLGCLPSLVASMDDYDRTVVEKAANVIKKFKHELIDICGRIGVSKETFLDNLSKTSNSSKLKTSTPNESTSGEESVYSENHVDDPSEAVDDKANPCDNTENTDIVQCISDIFTFDESKHYQNQSAEDDYIRNPLSIIQDILSYGQKSEEDNVVDCY